MSRGINQAGLDLVKSFEVLYDVDAYVCPAGVLAIGYGHTGDHVTELQCISMAIAENLLSQGMAFAASSVEGFVALV